MSIHYSDPTTYIWISDRLGMGKLIWVLGFVVSNTVTLWFTCKDFLHFLHKIFQSGAHWKCCEGVLKNHQILQKKKYTLVPINNP